VTKQSINAVPESIMLLANNAVLYINNYEAIILHSNGPRLKKKALTTSYIFMILKKN